MKVCCFSPWFLTMKGLFQVFQFVISWVSRLPVRVSHSEIMILPEDGNRGKSEYYVFISHECSNLLKANTNFVIYSLVSPDTPGWQWICLLSWKVSRRGRFFSVAQQDVKRKQIEKSFFLEGKMHKPWYKVANLICCHQRGVKDSSLSTLAAAPVTWQKPHKNSFRKVDEGF